MIERPDLTLDDFRARRLIFTGEGGGVFLAERDQRFYVITDESAMLSLLREEDAASLSAVRICEFSSAADRDVFVAERGWSRGGGWPIQQPPTAVVAAEDAEVIADALPHRLQGFEAIALARGVDADALRGAVIDRRPRSSGSPKATAVSNASFAP